MTASEIIDKLSSTHLSVYDFAHENIEYLEEDQVKLQEVAEIAKKNKDLKFYWEDPEYKKVSEEATNNVERYFKDLVGEWEEVEQHGGEGKGDDWWSVKYFKDHDLYIKVSGFYASYDGTTFDGWDSCKEVKPVQKTITVYK